MLPYPNRLSKSADITNVMRGGRRFIATSIRLHALTSEGKQTRVAVIVSKKISKSAVIRHRYQRWIRNIVHEHILKLPAQYDIVIAALPEIVKITSQSDLSEVVDKLFKKLH